MERSETVDTSGQVCSKAYAEHLQRMGAPVQDLIGAWEAYLKEHADLSAIEHLEPHIEAAEDWDTLVKVYEAALLEEDR